MDVEQTIEAMKPMQAFVDGKRIQAAAKAGRGGWGLATSPSWNLSTYVYRVDPPKPRILTHCGGGGGTGEQYNAIEITDEVKKVLEDAGICCGRS